MAVARGIPGGSSARRCCFVLTKYRKSRRFTSTYFNSEVMAPQGTDCILVRTMHRDKLWRAIAAPLSVACAVIMVNEPRLSRKPPQHDDKRLHSYKLSRCYCRYTQNYTGFHATLFADMNNCMLGMDYGRVLLSLAPVTVGRCSTRTSSFLGAATFRPRTARYTCSMW